MPDIPTPPVGGPQVNPGPPSKLTPNTFSYVDEEDVLWGFICTHPGLCGSGMNKFTSTGWPSEAIAKDRGQQHLNEHDNKVHMEPLEKFRGRHNLDQHGRVRN